jgi:ubiquinone/menaquinone biosynthesis C-methylase UbiE
MRTKSQTDDVFDVPCLWRDDAAAALGLSGEEVIAALSPGAAFPSALRSIASALPSDVRVIVDCGAGAGGASEWLRHELGVAVVAIEPASRARDVARRRFPQLDVRDGRAERTGLAEGSADVVVLCGVLSLVDDLDPVLDEVVRVLRRPHAHIAIADLFPMGAESFTAAPNTFRSFEDLGRQLRARGFEMVERGTGPAEPVAAWSHVAARVSAWIEENRADQEGFDRWRADQQHLQQLIDDGRLLGGCVVAAATEFKG